MTERDGSELWAEFMGLAREALSQLGGEIPALKVGYSRSPTDASWSVSRGLRQEVVVITITDGMRGDIYGDLVAEGCFDAALRHLAERYHCSDPVPALQGALCQLVWFLLFAHELGHVAYGHAFCLPLGGSHYIGEEPLGPGAAMESGLRAALELEADHYAGLALADCPGQAFMDFDCEGDDENEPFGNMLNMCLGLALFAVYYFMSYLSRFADYATGYPSAAMRAEELLKSFWGAYLAGLVVSHDGLAVCENKKGEVFRLAKADVIPILGEKFPGVDYSSEDGAARAAACLRDSAGDLGRIHERMLGYLAPVNLAKTLRTVANDMTLRNRTLPDLLTAQLISDLAFLPKGACLDAFSNVLARYPDHVPDAEEFRPALDYITAAILRSFPPTALAEALFLAARGDGLEGEMALADAVAFIKRPRSSYPPSYAKRFLASLGRLQGWRGVPSRPVDKPWAGHDPLKGPLRRLDFLCRALRAYQYDSAGEGR